MALELVEGMKQSPAVCFFCHGNPPGPEGNPMPCVTDTVVDFDWGETPYVCYECGGVIARLFGYVDKDESDRLKQELDDRNTQLEELKAEHEALTERVKRMLDGAKAKKEARQAAEASKKKVKADA